VTSSFVLAATPTCTVTVKLPLAVFPALSVALASTVVVAIGKVPPLAGRKLEAASPPGALALVVKSTTAPAALVASTVSGAGSVKVGATVSTVHVTLAGRW